MNPTLLAFSDTVTVALGVLVLVAAVLITSILRYQADDFVKFWAAVGTVIGLALGGVGTFFFTREQVEQKDSQLKATQVALQTSEKEKTAAGKQLTQLARYVTADSSASTNLKNVILTMTGANSGVDEHWWTDGVSPRWKILPATSPVAAPATSPATAPGPSISVSPSKKPPKPTP